MICAYMWLPILYTMVHVCLLWAILLGRISGIMSGSLLNHAIVVVRVGTWLRHIQRPPCSESPIAGTPIENPVNTRKTTRASISARLLHVVGFRSPSSVYAWSGSTAAFRTRIDRSVWGPLFKEPLLGSKVLAMSMFALEQVEKNTRLQSDSYHKGIPIHDTLEAICKSVV